VAELVQRALRSRADINVGVSVAGRSQAHPDSTSDSTTGLLGHGVNPAGFTVLAQIASFAGTVVK